MFVSPLARSAPPCNPPNEFDQLRVVTSWSAANSVKNWCEGRLALHLIEGRGESLPPPRPEYHGIRNSDRRWGLVCVDRNCNHFLKDSVGYYCGDGVPQKGAANVAVVKLFKGSCRSRDVRLVWEVQDQPGSWIYPPYAERYRGRYPDYGELTVPAGTTDANSNSSTNGNGGDTAQAEVMADAKKVV